MNDEKKSNLMLFVSRDVIADANRKLSQWRRLPPRDESGNPVESAGEAKDWIYPGHDQSGRSSDIPRGTLMPEALSVMEQIVNSRVFPVHTKSEFTRTAIHRLEEECMEILQNLNGNFTRLKTTWGNLKMLEGNVLAQMQFNKAVEIVTGTSSVIDGAKTIGGNDKARSFLELQLKTAQKNPDADLRKYFVDEIEKLIKTLK